MNTHKRICQRCTPCARHSTQPTSGLLLRNQMQHPYDHGQYITHTSDLCPELDVPPHAGAQVSAEAPSRASLEWSIEVPMVPGDLCDSDDDDSSTCPSVSTAYCVEYDQDCTNGGGGGGRGQASGLFHCTKCENTYISLSLC